MAKLIKTSTPSAIVKAPESGVAKFSQGLAKYLTDLRLPTEEVVTEEDERLTLMNNLPSVVSKLGEADRPDALYVSKFVVAGAAGLFDAALNYIWNEVIVRLRDRVARFDIGYFYDTAVPPADRKRFSTAEDLQNLSDADLINGCRKCGMITEQGYIQLDFIRDMRNWASAAHPNQSTITGLQLATWFETCIREVINREFSHELLEVGRLLKNIREQTFTQPIADSIATSLRSLPTPLVTGLLRSLVGHYCDPKQDVRVTANIRLIAAPTWNLASESARAGVGITHANYSVNGDVDRKQRCREFLELVDGLPYLSEAELALEFTERIKALESAHDGWDNFYNEPSPAAALRRLVGSSGRVPSQINEEYVRVVVRARVGRRRGLLARGAIPSYDEMIDLFGTEQAKAFVATLNASDVQNVLMSPPCATNFRAIAQRIRSNIVDRPVLDVLDAIIAASDAQLPKLMLDSTFKKLVARL